MNVVWDPEADTGLLHYLNFLRSACGRVCEPFRRNLVGLLTVKVMSQPDCGFVQPIQRLPVCPYQRRNQKEDVAKGKGVSTERRQGSPS